MIQLLEQIHLVRARLFVCLFVGLFLSPGGLVKLKLKLTTLPRLCFPDARPAVHVEHGGRPAEVLHGVHVLGKEWGFEHQAAVDQDQQARTREAPRYSKQYSVHGCKDRLGQFLFLIISPSLYFGERVVPGCVYTLIPLLKFGGRIFYALVLGRERYRPGYVSILLLPSMQCIRALFSACLSFCF